jgi:hypothetical protein
MGFVRDSTAEPAYARILTACIDLKEHKAVLCLNKQPAHACHHTANKLETQFTNPIPYMLIPSILYEFQ